MDVRGRDQPLRAWLDHLRVERGLSENTLVAYENDLRKLVAFAEGQGHGLLSLGQGEMAAFIGSLRERGPLGRSQARHVHSLRGFYRFAAREGLIARATRWRTCGRRRPSARCRAT